MIKSKADTLLLLKIFEKTLENLDDTEYKGLISGKGCLIYQPKREEVEDNKDETKPLEQTDNKVQINLEMKELIEKIAKAELKEEAEQLLPMKLKKAILLEIASAFSIHIRKNDSKETIIFKIIDSVVGAKLRSQAVRETELRFKRVED